MCTKLRRKVDVAGPVESSDKAGGAEDCLQHGASTGGIGLDIAGSQIMGREQRWVTGEVDNDIGGDRCGCFGRFELKISARRHALLRKAVDRQDECAEIAFG
jgi:hypothetical protein